MIEKPLSWSVSWLICSNVCSCDCCRADWVLLFSSLMNPTVCNKLKLDRHEWAYAGEESVLVQHCRSHSMTAVLSDPARQRAVCWASHLIGSPLTVMEAHDLSTCVWIWEICRGYAPTPPPLPTPPAACTTVVCKTPAKFFTLKKNDSWLMHDSWQFPLLKLHRELKKKRGLAWFLHNWCGKKTKKAFILFCFGAFFLKLPTLF